MLIETPALYSTQTDRPPFYSLMPRFDKVFCESMSCARAIAAAGSSDLKQRLPYKVRVLSFWHDLVRHSSNCAVYSVVRRLSIKVNSSRFVYLSTKMSNWSNASLFCHHLAFLDRSR